MTNRFAVQPGPWRIAEQDRDWEVVMRGDSHREVVDRLPTQEEARAEAAIRAWAYHLDDWMSSAFEDQDIAEDVAEVLGLMADLDLDAPDAEGQYDEAIKRALAYLPGGMRRLADIYEREWKDRGISK